MYDFRSKLMELQLFLLFRRKVVLKRKYILIIWTSVALLIAIGGIFIGIHESVLNETIKKADNEINYANDLLNDGLIQYEQVNDLKVEIQELENVKATRNNQAIKYETKNLVSLNKQIQKIDNEFDKNLGKLYTETQLAQKYVNNKMTNENDRELLVRILKNAPGRPISAKPAKVAQLVKQLHTVNQKIGDALKLKTKDNANT